MNTTTLLFLLFFSGLCLGLLFELKWFYLIFIGTLYSIVLSRIKNYQEQQRAETQTFRLINSYMSQISQSFIRNKNILSALQETAD